MRMTIFAKRCAKEILRDPINLSFGLGFPLVFAEIEKIMGEELRFDVCAKSEATMLAVRERINEMIKAKV